MILDFPLAQKKEEKDKTSTPSKSKEFSYIYVRQPYSYYANLPSRSECENPKGIIE